MEYVAQLIGFQNRSLKRAFAPLGVFAAHLHDHFIPHPRNNYHPHILGHRNLALMSALLVGVKIFTLSALSLSPAATAFSSAITAQNIINLTNESRKAFGLTALSQNSVLDIAAQAKADDMLAKGYFSHLTPDGKSPWEFIKAAGYTYIMAGENLAVNFTESEDVEEAWMNSPGHKANILNKNFEEIGIGISQGQYQGHAAIFVVQMFGTPIEQQVALEGEPTVVQVEAVPPPINNIAPAQGSALGQSENRQPILKVLNVKSGEVKILGDNVEITAQVEGPAVKVIAYFGQQAVMLSPREGNVWVGQMVLGSLTQSNKEVTIKAFDIKGESVQLQLADFAASIQQNYHTVGSTPPTYATFLNRTFDPKSFEAKVYLIFIAGLLSVLILAIAIKRHVQHLSLIANSSFVVIFAALLFWAG